MPQLFDLAARDVRELNRSLQLERGDAVSELWRVVNPRGAHNVAVGIDAAHQVDIDGHVGYYCAGMNQRATITVRGNAGPGRGGEHDVGHWCGSTVMPLSTPVQRHTAVCW